MFEFAWPWILALAPLPWLFRRVLPPVPQAESALKISFLHELESLAGTKARHVFPSWKRQLPFAIIWILLLLSAARPQWLGEPLPVSSNGRDLLLAVDVSGSMSFSDMQLNGQAVSRLEAVQHFMGPFLEARQGDRVGLILFGTQPYLQSPLTFDRRTVKTWLNEAQVGIAGTQTALGDAIGLGIKQLLLRPAESRVLILITDGANNGGVLSPTLAASLAAQQQVKIYTIGIGASASGGFSNMLGLQAAQDLDEPTLKMIADKTQGQYFRAHDTRELKRIQKTLDDLEPVSYQAALTRTQQALYMWPLAAAMLVAFGLMAQGTIGNLSQKFWQRRGRHD